MMSIPSPLMSKKESYRNRKNNAIDVKGKNYERNRQKKLKHKEE